MVRFGLLLFVVGCQGLTGEANERFDLTEQTAEVLCECPEYSVGTSSARECLDFYSAFLTFSDVQRDCVLEAYRLNPQESADALECINRVDRDYLDCFESSSCDEDLLDDCAERNQADVNACPEFPATTLAAIEDCYE